MDNALNSTLNAAVMTLLRPLVRILLRNGVAWGAFAELAKKTYADIAWQEFAEPGRKPSVSRVSALTGLTRKEAKRLLELDDPADGEGMQRYHRAVRVISGWLNDSAFRAPDGQPLPLPLEGEATSFAALVKRYSGDIPPRAMLAVLEAAESVRVEDGRVHLVRHAYVPSRDPVDKIRILGTDTAELIGTIDHNLTSPPDDLWFQRKVSNNRVRAGALREFRALSAERAQALLEELDAWLARHESPENAEAGAPEDAPCYVSLGIYYHEQPDSQAQGD